MLNNLKEGVFIIDEETAEIRFKNSAVTRIDRRLKDACSFSLFEGNEERLVLKVPKFQLMDYKCIKQDDASTIMLKLRDGVVPEIRM